jgi:hypothetical protein
MTSPGSTEATSRWTGSMTAAGGALGGQDDGGKQVELFGRIDGFIP